MANNLDPHVQSCFFISKISFNLYFTTGWLLLEKSVIIGKNLLSSIHSLSKRMKSSFKCMVPCLQLTPRNPSVHWYTSVILVLKIEEMISFSLSYKTSANDII